MAGGKLQMVKAGSRTPTKAIKQYVNKEINKSIETKERNHLYEEQTISNLDTYPTTLTFTDISSGRDDNQRVGNELLLTKLQYKLFLHNKSAVDSVVRVVVVRAKGNITNTNMGYGDKLFKSGNTSVNYTSATYPQRLAKDIDRTNYTVLSDKIVKLGALDKSEENNKILRFTKYYKKKKVSYNNQSDSIATNPIKLMIWNIDSAMDTNTVQCELTGEISTFYKDA